MVELHDSEFELGIPSTYSEARCALQAKKPFLDLVVDYLRSPAERYRCGEGALLSGNYGTGKTWTAVALANSLGSEVRRNLCPLLIASADLADRAYPMGQDVWVEGWNATYTHVVETCPCLIVDEFGAEIRAGGRGPIVLQKLRRLLKARLNDRTKKVTFITTNLQIDHEYDGSLVSEMGTPIVSVVNELCPYQVQVDGVDLRDAGVKRF